MLDIHVAPSVNAATRSEPVCSIPLEEHALLFADMESLNEFPLILQMNGYWTDTHIPADNVAKLGDEIRYLKSRLAHDSLKLRMLNKLEFACRHASKTGQAMYLLAD